MTKDLSTTPRLPALEKLRQEFLRIARAESRARRRLGLQRLTVAFVGVLIVVPVGFALAEEGSNGRQRGPSASSTIAPSTGSESPVAPSVPPGVPADFISEHEAVTLGLIPAESEADEVDFGAEGAPAWLVEDCRTLGAEAVGTTALHCRAIIAIDEGRLSPGEYSDEELREELGE